MKNLQNSMRKCGRKTKRSWILSMKKPSNLDKDRERKTEGAVVRGGTWSEIRCYSVPSGVELQMVPSTKCRLPDAPASGSQISGHLPTSGSIENQTGSDTFLVVLPSLDALRSAFFRWLSLFPLERLSGLGCWSSHEVVGRASV